MLADLQGKFKDTLLNPRETRLSLTHEISGTLAPERLGIYQNNVSHSLTETLRTAFPVTEKIVGPDFFREAARHFIAAHPPKEACLSRYGASFPRWLGQQPQTSSLPYLTDIALYEWARLQCWGAGTLPFLSSDVFSQKTEEELSATTLSFAPSVLLYQSSFPTYQIWCWTHKIIDTPPDFTTPSQTSLILHRHNGVVKTEEISSLHMRFLLSLKQEETLGQALNQLLLSGGSLAEFQQFIAHALQNDLFCSHS